MLGANWKGIKGNILFMLPPKQNPENDGFYEVIRKFQNHKKNANFAASITLVIGGIILLVSEEFFGLLFVFFN